MTERLPRFALLPLVSALATTPLLAQEVARPAQPPSGTVAAQPNPIDQWLEEVRAQREAWEARRRAAKEAIDARRRWIDPWGAAQKEAREQESQRRRDALREQIERERELLRNQSPWAAQPAPWQNLPTSPGTAETPAGPQNERVTPPAEGNPPSPPYPPLPGWDNRWYYRGF